MMPTKQELISDRRPWPYPIRNGNPRDAGDEARIID